MRGSAVVVLVQSLHISHDHRLQIKSPSPDERVILCLVQEGKYQAQITYIPTTMNAYLHVCEFALWLSWQVSRAQTWRCSQ